MAKRIMLMLVLAVVSAGVLSGCGTVVKEGLGATMGPKGTFVPIRPVAPADESRPLGEYKRFELGAFTDDMGGKVPTELLAHLPGGFTDALIKKKLPNAPSGKTLLLRGRISHYEGQGLVWGMLSPIEEVVARTEMVDKASGKVLGVANCVGRTTTRVNKGVAKKGIALGKALAAWIDARYPKEGR